MVLCICALLWSIPRAFIRPDLESNTECQMQHRIWIMDLTSPLMRVCLSFQEANDISSIEATLQSNHTLRVHVCGEEVEEEEDSDDDD